MGMKFIGACAGAFFALMAAGETASCDAVSLALSGDSSSLTVTYRLTGAPAVVTLDIETNTLADATGAWVSIGGAAVSTAQGDVWKKVDPAETRTITWTPKASWPNHVVAAGGLRARVSAWQLDDTPDYMVMGLVSGASDRVRYYPDVDFLPGGLLKNEAYRTTSLVMRRIHARDVTWKMGSDATVEAGYRDTDGREAQHDVTLDHDYYIAVFPITQQQYQIVSGETGQYAFRAYYTRERRMRPVERIAYIRIRTCDVAAWKDDSAYDYPNDPCPGSFLGRLRAISRWDGGAGIDFDLPGEAEWEYACRAGHGDGLWGDGSAFQGATSDGNLMRLTRCAANQAGQDADSDPAVGGSAIVGTYEPNSWGLYDMHGNVGEYCLDFWKKNITDRSRGEIVKRADADDRTSLQRRGCDPASARYHRSAQRGSRATTSEDKGLGFRVACRAGLN